MPYGMKRREFLKISSATGAIGFGGIHRTAHAAAAGGAPLVSPGCRRTKVRVARIYMGTAHGLWPKPNLNFEEEIRFYRDRFGEMVDELTDVDFVVDELITSGEQAAKLKGRLGDVDGVLAIHFNIGIGPILQEVLAAGKPTVVFADPYSGHEWVGFGAMEKEERGANLACMLTSDYTQLAAAVRPFRAIHHLREAKILNLTTRQFDEYAKNMRETFGTEIKRIELDRMLDAYRAVPESDAKTEAVRWIDGATAVVEPSREEIVNSCRLALAFERLLDEENATVMTADCYGTMFGPLCQKVAFPCIGFTRLNDMGYGGICESDLQSAMTHIIFQGLTGKPGFISDPTVDESNNTIILAHCLGTTKMDGPDGFKAPYKLRTIMEREEGAVPQVSMQIGRRVTQAKLVGTDFMPYFTGEIVGVPDTDRGCRTKIAVRPDGDLTHLWKNWSSGLHRVTCYGDITKDLERFSKFTNIRLVNEAV